MVAIWMHYTNANYTHEEKDWWLLHKNASSLIGRVLETALQKGVTTSLIFQIISHVVVFEIIKNMSKNLKNDKELIEF